MYFNALNASKVLTYENEKKMQNSPVAAYTLVYLCTYFGFTN